MEKISYLKLEAVFINDKGKLVTVEIKTDPKSEKGFTISGTNQGVAQPTQQEFLDLINRSMNKLTIDSWLVERYVRQLDFLIRYGDHIDYRSYEFKALKMQFEDFSAVQPTQFDHVNNEFIRIWQSVAEYLASGESEQIEFISTFKKQGLYSERKMKHVELSERIMQSLLHLSLSWDKKEWDFSNLSQFVLSFENYIKIFNQTAEKQK